MKIIDRLDWNRPEGFVGEKDFAHRLVYEFGTRFLRSSALGLLKKEENGTEVYFDFEQKFRSHLRNKNIKVAVEIGTLRGVSTTVLAHYAERVITIDNHIYTEPMTLWAFSGLSKKITQYKVDSDQEKKELVDSLDFDFAFIDGDHEYEGVKFDFEITKRCGRVLFHDFFFDSPVYTGPKKVIEALPKEQVKLDPPFAYWEDNV